MYKRGCPGVPVAAIVKVGDALRLRWIRRSGHVLRTIALLPLDSRHAKDVLCLVSVFRRCALFKLLTPKFMEATEKSGLGEKRPVNGKFLKFRCMRGFAGIHGFTDSCQVTEVTKRVCGIHHEKSLIFCRFLWSFLSDPEKNFTGSLFLSHPHPLRWLNGVTVRASDLRSGDSGFDSRSGHYQAT